MFFHFGKNARLKEHIILVGNMCSILCGSKGACVFRARLRLRTFSFWGLPMPHSKRLSRPSDKKHFKEMLRGELLQNCFNRTPLWLIPLRNFWLKRLLGSIDGTAYCVNSPFRVGYGKIIHGEKCPEDYGFCPILSLRQSNISLIRRRKPSLP